ncbi:unnamed protein product [Spirodela intermedia]|uniref:Uncharacterized protein n=1 Tax=Spirodela intermedia TaxID=51605 RepID=A0A7I8JDB9_SPIIN|nr:unnamed protein product [Spirodela intermedia]CAA6667725.1 unnamed protein product [Spirodela intermedia]
MAAALCCLAKKKKMKKKVVVVAETDVVHVEDHVRVHENIFPGPHGEHIVVVSVDEDLRVNEEIKRAELSVEASTHAQAAVTEALRGTMGQPPPRPRATALTSSMTRRARPSPTPLTPTAVILVENKDINPRDAALKSCMAHLIHCDPFRINFQLHACSPSLSLSLSSSGWAFHQVGPAKKAC